MKKLEFGVIDDDVVLKSALVGVFGSVAAETISHAKITVSTTLSGAENTTTMDLVGKGVYTTGFYITDEKAFTKAVEEAIFNFAQKLTVQIEDSMNR